MRLTTHDKGRQPYVITANERTWREIYDKLAAYEDTGVEPEEIEDRQDVCLWIPEDRFAEIINAEAQGRLVILPCKVGTPVWSSVLCRIGEDMKEYPAQWPFTISMMDEWGTGFFMTKEEAEAALKGEREDV